MIGVVGTVITPLNRRRSWPGGMFRFQILTRCLIANTGTMLLQGSHASPMPSPSLSSCAGSGLFGQSSIRSHTPSPSVSCAMTSAGQAGLEPVQRSAGSHGPVEGRHSAVAG